MSSAIPTASVQSPLALLRANPRFVGFTIVMFPAAMALGAFTQTRTASAANSSAGTAGIGAVTMAIAIAAAAAALLSGGLSDRFGARVVFIVTTLAALAVNLVGNFLALASATTAISFLLTSAAGGAIAAMNMTSLVPMSMGIAPPEARSAVQIVNMLRMAVGVMFGVWLAGLIAQPVIVGFVSTAMIAACSLAAAALSPAGGAAKPDAPDSAAPGRSGAGIAGTLAVLRHEPLLRTTILVLLALDVVIPSQLVAVVLSDNQLFKHYHTLVLAGLAGALVSRLILTLTGLRIRVRAWLLTAFSAYTVACLVGALLFHTQVLLSSQVLMAAAVFIGSVTSGFAIEVNAALVQQRCPDEIRGRITGTVQAGRTLMTAVGVAIAATLQVATDEAPLMLALAVLSILVLLATRGFAVITERNAPAPGPVGAQAA